MIVRYPKNADNCAGTSTGQHILGHTALRRVPKIIEEDLRIAGRDAVYVYRGRRCSNGIIRAPEMISPYYAETGILLCGIHNRSTRNLEMEIKAR